MAMYLFLLILVLRLQISGTKVERMALIVLKRSLSGSAALMLRSLSETNRDDRSMILDALKARFGSAGREAIFQAELSARKRHPGGNSF